MPDLTRRRVRKRGDTHPVVVDQFQPVSPRSRSGHEHHVPVLEVGVGDPGFAQAFAELHPHLSECRQHSRATGILAGHLVEQ